jgi:hypothetical protein
MLAVIAPPSKGYPNDEAHFFPNPGFPRFISAFCDSLWQKLKQRVASRTKNGTS